jgi:hypothetical protein
MGQCFRPLVTLLVAAQLSGINSHDVTRLGPEEPIDQQVANGALGLRRDRILEVDDNAVRVCGRLTKLLGRVAEHEQDDARKGHH